MSRYDIALNKISEKKVSPTSDDVDLYKKSKRCELWKIKEDGMTQGAVCHLKFLNKFENPQKYGQPFCIKLKIKVPCEFHIPLSGELLLKLDGEEYPLIIREVKQDYTNPKKISELSGILKSSLNPRTPQERRDLRDHNIAKLLEDSKHQPYIN